MPKKDITYVNLGPTKRIQIPLNAKQKQRLDQITEEKGITQKECFIKTFQDFLNGKLSYEPSAPLKKKRLKLRLPKLLLHVLFVQR